MGTERFLLHRTMATNARVRLSRLYTRRPFARVQDTERLRLRYTEEERAEIQDYAAQ